MSARNAAILGVVLALAVAALAVLRRPNRGDLRPGAVETTRAVRLVRRDRVGLPEKKGMVREPARVRALTAALGIDGHAIADCPPDYADADVGVVLSGDDVYARRNVYVFGLLGDAGVEPSIVSVTSAGCRVGPPTDVAALRRELTTAGVLD